MNLECIPCFQRQAIEATRMASNDSKVQRDILRKVFHLLNECSWEDKPPIIAEKVHALVRNELGADPYEAVKKDSNDKALSLYPYMKGIITDSNDPIVSAIRIAVAGNIIDFGPTSSFDFEKTLKESMYNDFAIDDCDFFKESCSNSSSILYLVDNAGEIVCDRLLIETLLAKHPISNVTIGVKGGNILNDATTADISYIGLDSISEVDVLRISNGEAYTGIPRESHAFRNVMDNYDMIISKGQGNYEMLSEYDDVFFLLRAKCALIARDADVPIGSMICGRNVHNRK